jgi:hypothetical protein
MKRPPMRLLNCTRCDDVLQLVDKGRFCECGQSHGVANDAGVSVTGPARVLTIEWESYDGLTEGTTGEVGVLPRDRWRSKGSL